MSGDPIREMRLDVRPGLYALRYVSSADLRTAPSATVRPVPASMGTVEIVSAPGLAPGQLAGPGSCVVLVASATGAVDIALTAFGGGQNLDARFSLDLLGSAEQALAGSAPRSAAGAAAATPSRAEAGAALLDIAAHVSRRGDVGVDGEGWIAGPRAPSPIEAIQIQARGRDIGVAAQFRNVELRSTWSAWLTPGSVIGTPRRACPLTAVRLKLVGAEADRFDIVGEALFLGVPKVTARGGEIEFVAPGELDPLIGLKLAVAERPAAPVQPLPQAAEKVSRVRVFR